MSEPSTDNGAWLKVAIGVPSRGEWSSDCCMSVAALMAHFAKHCAGECRLIAMGGVVLPEQRSRIWAEAHQWGATHLLFIDDDMGFPPDALVRLLRHGEPIVGVNYPRKAFPYVPTAYQDDEAGTGPVYTREESKGLQQVRHIGFGVCLIDMRVFEALFDESEDEAAARKLVANFIRSQGAKIPPHMRPQFTNRPPAFFHFEPAADGIKWCTEDVYFFRRVKARGIKVYLDHDLSKEVRHIGRFKFENYNSVACEEATLATWSAGINAKPLINEVAKGKNSRIILPDTNGIQ